mmetsp:Transcript_22063/g.31639  ORF Transcript_22063/g.31639 Transcript_22063/m.31639 type:complete len:102 (+) Transcript_22063:395-700(+)
MVVDSDPREWDFRARLVIRRISRPLGPFPPFFVKNPSLSSVFYRAKYEEDPTPEKGSTLQHVKIEFTDKQETRQSYKPFQPDDCSHEDCRHSIREQRAHSI